MKFLRNSNSHPNPQCPLWPQVKTRVQRQIIDVEAWHIASSVAEGKVFTNLKTQNEGFESSGQTKVLGNGGFNNSGPHNNEQLALFQQQMVQQQQMQQQMMMMQQQHQQTMITTLMGGSGNTYNSVTQMPMQMPMQSAPQSFSGSLVVNKEEELGILNIQISIPPWQVRGEFLEENYGQPVKSRLLQDAVGVWDVNEDAISFGLTALKKLLDTLDEEDLQNIGRLEVGTESNVDMAKSIKSYLTQLFPADNSRRELLGVDNINACYGGILKPSMTEMIRN
jgi:hypothetical protein